MFNLIFQDMFGCYYQLLPRGIPPLCSCGDRFVADDHVRTYQLITSNLEIHFTHWRGLLMRLGIAIPPNFDDAYDILQEVTRLCMRGEFVFYKMPELGFLPALSMGNGWGYCFVRGPRPHLFTDHELIIINSKQEAEALMASVNATEGNLRSCAEPTLLFKNLFDYSQSIRPDFIELLVERKLLAYKVPVRMAAPKVKAEELVDATGAGNRPVPLGPETKTAPSAVISSSNENPSPQSLDDCEKSLAEARKKLDAEGYAPKYTDQQQLEKVQTGSVSKERFLVSFQTENTNPDAKLAFQRESGLAPVWATSFDQLENADTDPELIAQVLGTNYDPQKQYVMHIVDRGEKLDGFGQNTIVPTWDNMQAPVQKYLGGKHDAELLGEVMTPEYQEQYARDMAVYHTGDLKEFDFGHQKQYASTMSNEDRKKFNARHNVRTEIGANSEFTGNGLTKSNEGKSKYGVVETLTLESNPPPISQMKNVKTVLLKPRGIVV